METRLSRAVALAAYPLTLLLGIVLFPIAVLASKLGLTLPIHRVLGWISDLYERTDSR